LREIISNIQNWSLENHILRQDEVANFVHLTKGRKYSVLLPLLGLDNLEYAVNNLQSLIKAINEVSKRELVSNKIGSLVGRVNRYFKSSDF